MPGNVARILMKRNSSNEAIYNEGAPYALKTGDSHNFVYGSFRRNSVRSFEEDIFGMDENYSRII